VRDDLVDPVEGLVAEVRNSSQNEGDSAAGVSAARALARYLDPRAVDALIAALRSRRASVKLQVAAADSLVAMNALEGVAALRRAAAFEARSTANAARAALSRLCPRRIPRRGVYVFIRSVTADGPLDALAKKMATLILRRKLSTGLGKMTSWPGCIKPDSDALNRAAVTAYALDLKIKTKERLGRSHCRFEVLVTTHPQNSIRGRTSVTTRLNGVLCPARLRQLLTAAADSLTPDLAPVLKFRGN
jgi:hypothetical protein